MLFSWLKFICRVKKLVHYLFFYLSRFFLRSGQKKSRNKSGFFILFFLQNFCLYDFLVFGRLIHKARSAVFYFFDSFISFDDFAENRMVVVKPRGFDRGYEKLASVRVGACFCHGEQSFAVEFEIWRKFVLERLSPN